jgi:hypothetical protein
VTLQEHKPPAAPTYTDQQVANAKIIVCAAFEKVQHAVNLANTHGESTDYAKQLGAAALRHEALDAGSRCLLKKLAEERARQPDLSNRRPERSKCGPRSSEWLSEWTFPF